MSGQQIWVRSRDKAIGPFSVERIRKLAQAGKITPKTLISLDRKKWTPAGKARGITFPRGPQAETGTGDSPPKHPPREPDSTPRTQPAQPAPVKSSTTQGSKPRPERTVDVVRAPHPALSQPGKPPISPAQDIGRRVWQVIDCAAICVGTCLFAVVLSCLVAVVMGLIEPFLVTAAFGYGSGPSHSMVDLLMKMERLRHFFFSIPVQYLLLTCCALAMWKHRTALSSRMGWFRLFTVIMAVSPLVGTSLRHGWVSSGPKAYFMGTYVQGLGTVLAAWCLWKIFRAEAWKAVGIASRQGKMPVLEQTQTSRSTPESFTEDANLGTRHDSKDVAIAYWMVERRMSDRKDPFVMSNFKRESQARRALLELPCIHVASDSNNLICTEPLVFGCYSIGDTFEAILCGDDLTYELWDQAKRSFEKHGGTLKNELEPKKRGAPKSRTKVPDTGEVSLVREERNSGFTGQATYRVYKGPSRDAAMAFLKQSPVTEDLLYLVVETPEGNYCRDKTGIYKELTAARTSSPAPPNGPEAEDTTGGGISEVRQEVISKEVYVISSKALDPFSLKWMGEVPMDLAIKKLRYLEDSCPAEAIDALLGYTVGRTATRPVVVGILYRAQNVAAQTLLSWLNDEFLPQHGFLNPPFDPSLQVTRVSLDAFRNKLTEIKQEVSLTGAKLVSSARDDSNTEHDTPAVAGRPADTTGGMKEPDVNGSQRDAPRNAAESVWQIDASSDAIGLAQERGVVNPREAGVVLLHTAASPSEEGLDVKGTIQCHDCRTEMEFEGTVALIAEACGTVVERVCTACRARIEVGYSYDPSQPTPEVFLLSRAKTRNPGCSAPMPFPRITISDVFPARSEAPPGGDEIRSTHDGEDRLCDSPTQEQAAPTRAPSVAEGTGQANEADSLPGTAVVPLRTTPEATARSPSKKPASLNMGGVGDQSASAVATIVGNELGQVLINLTNGRLIVLGPGGGFSRGLKELADESASTVDVLKQCWESSCEGGFPFREEDLVKIQKAMAAASRHGKAPVPQQT